MKLRVFIPTVWFAVACVAAQAANDRQIVIPLTPVVTTMSPEMADLRAEVLAIRSASEPFAGWEQLDSLPEWVWEVEERAMVFIAPRPLLQHDFRYALILGPHGEVIVVREGGLAGTRVIYFQKRDSFQPAQPTTGRSAAVEAASWIDSSTAA